MKYFLGTTAGVLTICEVILLSNRSWEGWLVASIAQVLWVYHFAKRKDFSALLIAIILLVLDIHGLIQWYVAR